MKAESRLTFRFYPRDTHRWFIQITARPRLSDRNGGHFVRIIERDYVLTKRGTIIRCINKPARRAKTGPSLLSKKLLAFRLSPRLLFFLSKRDYSLFHDQLIIAC